jgi:CRP-like cAMP-binding protein
MVPDDVDRLLLKLRSRDDVSPEEEKALRWAVFEVKEIPKDKVAIREKVELTTSTLLLQGMMVRYKDLSDSARQITQLHVPGDFVDLHSFTLKRLDHNVMTITDCRLATFPHDRLREITEKHPHLARLLWFSTNVDGAAHREWELSLGRRSAVQRIAHLFCELYYRLKVVGLTDGTSFAFPMTQTEIAEAKGLTSVHVNRTLKELREGEFVTVQKGLVTIHDLHGLMRICEFDPAYLYLERHPI